LPVDFFLTLGGVDIARQRSAARNFVLFAQHIAENGNSGL